MKTKEENKEILDNYCKTLRPKDVLEKIVEHRLLEIVVEHRLQEIETKKKRGLIFWETA